MDKIFKAKRINNGEWVEFESIIYCNEKCYFFKYGSGDFDSIPLLKTMEIDEKTICQYTGINDKYGNKIFEGDEVKGYEHEPDSPYIVRYHAGKYSCGFVAADNEDYNPYINIWYDGLTLTVKNIHDD
jgi:uncharacterized phage protein (TIGR01671 family)